MCHPMIVPEMSVIAGISHLGALSSSSDDRFIDIKVMCVAN